MRTVELNAVKGGINRQRVKGGASGQVLYDLHNGYVTASRTCASRPGTDPDAELPPGTHGLCAFEGGFVVFATAAKVMADSRYTCEVIFHPTVPATDLLKIHFAGPFLGYLYVVAEFVGGDVFHYWLQRRDAWKAGTVYREGDIVEPTTRNGLAYRARRIDPASPKWAPDVARAVGDIVEPTVANGFRYTAVETLGASPKSGKTEPTWPALDGARVREDTDLTQPTVPTDDSSDTTLPSDVLDRYRGLMAGRASNSSTRGAL